MCLLTMTRCSALPSTMFTSRFFHDRRQLGQRNGSSAPPRFWWFCPSWRSQAPYLADARNVLSTGQALIFACGDAFGQAFDRILFDRKGFDGRRRLPCSVAHHDHLIRHAGTAQKNPLTAKGWLDAFHLGQGQRFVVSGPFGRA